MFPSTHMHSIPVIRGTGQFSTVSICMLSAYEATRGVPNAIHVIGSDVQIFKARGQILLDDLETASAKMNYYKCIILIISILQACKRYVKKNNSSFGNIQNQIIKKNVHVKNDQIITMFLGVFFYVLFFFFTFILFKFVFVFILSGLSKHKISQVNRQIK